MLFLNVAVLSSLTALLVSARDIDRDDVPAQCMAICAPVSALARSCDDSTNDDVAELNCICSATNAGTLIPTCDACVAQFLVPGRDDNDRDDKTPDVNDVRQLRTRCNLSTTSYNAASASAAIGSATLLPPGAGPNGPRPSGGIVTMTSGTVVITTSIAAPTATPPPGQQGQGQGQGRGPAGTTNAGASRKTGATVWVGGLAMVLVAGML